MRSFLALLLLCGVAAVSCGAIERLLEKTQDEPVVIVDAGNSDNERPFNPFFYEGPVEPPIRKIGFGELGFGSEFAKGLNGMLARLQTQFDSLWRRFYDRVDGVKPDFTVNRSEFPPSFRNITSTKKVVNGSVITVNETIDKQSDNNSMSFFHVKVIHVRPENPLPPYEDGILEDVPHEGPNFEVPSPNIPAMVPGVSGEDDGVKSFVTEREPLKPGLSEENQPKVEDNMP